MISDKANIYSYAIDVEFDKIELYHVNQYSSVVNILYSQCFMLLRFKIRYMLLIYILWMSSGFRINYYCYIMVLWRLCSR